MHAYEPGFPLAPTAPTAPPPRSAMADYQRFRGGPAARALVVQPSHYGRDNRATLFAAARLGGAATVVIGREEATEAGMAALAAAGAVGARFHLARAPAVSWEDLPEVAACAAPLGWHVSVQMRGAELLDRRDALRRLPCALVLEHFGRPEGDEAVIRAVLRLLESGRAWVKLSAPDLLSPGGADPLDARVAVLARRLASAAPDRVLWGSNWPHPNRLTRPPPDDAVLAAPQLWFGEDPAMLHRLLHGNPAALLRGALRSAGGGNCPG